MSANGQPFLHLLLFMRVVAWLAIASFLFGAWEAGSSYYLYQRGKTLERSLDAEQVTDPDQIWAKWTELSSGNPSSLFLYGPRKAVKQKFVEAADRVITAYRNGDSQPVYEKDWERARVLLTRALAVDPSDTVRGKLRLCEGHIARINGTSHHDPQQLALAVEKFNEAQRLLGGSPDPQLGLARVYVYGLKDIDKAYEALALAERHGFHLGNREKIQLADGYRDRADRLFWDSRNVRGLPQEKDQITRASDDYKHALNLYQEVAPYANAAAQIVRVQTSSRFREFAFRADRPLSMWFQDVLLYRSLTVTARIGAVTVRERLVTYRQTACSRARLRSER